MEDKGWVRVQRGFTNDSEVNGFALRTFQMKEIEFAKP
jgi:hypothetical protein